MNKSDSLHPAAFFVALYLSVAVGRLPEIFEFLRPFYLGKVTILLALIIIFLNWDNTNKLSEATIGRRMIAFTALCLVSLSFSIWRSGTLAFISKDLLGVFSVFFLTFKTAVNITTIRFYFTIFAVILGMMTIMALLASTSGRMVISSSYDPNDVGLVVLTASALLYGYSRDRKVSYRIYLILFSVLGFFVALSTQSRGAFLGVVAVVTFFMFSNDGTDSQKIYRWPSFRTIAGVAFCAVIIVALLPDSSWDRIFTIFDLENDYNTTGETGRLAIWQRGIDTFLSRPWGVGAGVYQSADVASGGRYHTAHNSILQIAVELGLIGMLIFLSFHSQLWRTTGRLMRARGVHDKVTHQSAFAMALGLRGAIIAFLVTSFFLSMGYSRIFYALLGLGAAIEMVVLKAVDSRK